VLYKQHGQPSLLRAVQRKLPSNVLAHSAVPMVGSQAPTHLVMTSSDLEHSPVACFTTLRSSRRAAAAAATTTTTTTTTTTKFYYLE